MSDTPPPTQDLPFADDLFPSQDQTSDGKLPTPEELFPEEKTTNAQAVGSFFKATLFNPFTVSSPEAAQANNALLQKSAVGRVLDKFGMGVSDALPNPYEQPDLGLSPETVQSLKDHGIFNDVAKGQNNWLKGAIQGVAMPLAANLDAMAQDIGNAINAPFAGASAALAQASEEVSGIPFIGKPAAATLGAYGEIAGDPMGAIGAESPHVTHADIAEARANNAIGVPEEVYMGLKEPTTAQAAAQNEAAIQSAAFREVPPYAEPKEEAPVQDIHQIARNIAPETFDQYDRLSTSKNGLQNSLNYLNEQRQREAEENAPHTDEISDLKEKLEDANARKSKIYQSKIDELIETNESAIANAKAADTPEMAQIRQRLQEIDYKMRDLAPDVSAAYRAAQEYVPAEPVAETAPVVRDQPQGETPQEKPRETQQEPIVAPLKSVEDQHSVITSDISRQLMAAGRPEEEANASAQLVAEHYQARSDRFGGANGNAEEMYNRDMADVKAAKNVKQSAREFAQPKPPPKELNQMARGKIRLATDDAKATITLMKNANASTFIHETGHHWLDEMMRDAMDEKAPQDLKDDAATVHKWLGTNPDEDIPTRAHEKFARGFERYMMEGTAPNQKLAGVFSKFKQWLTQIYQTVDRLRSPITDDIRDVFNRLLSTKQQEPIMAAEKPVEKASEDHPFWGPSVRDFKTSISKVFADIHKSDADNTPPERADITGDKVEREIDHVSKHDEGSSDAITNGQAPEVTAEAGGNESATPAGEPTAGSDGVPQEPSNVASGGSSSPAEGGGLREVGRSRSDGSGSATGARSATGGRTEDPESPNARFKPESNLVDKAGNIRLDNLNTPEDVNEVLRQTATDNNDFMSSRRGVLSSGEVIDLADALGMDAAMLDKRKIGQAYNAEQIIAARKLLIKSATDLKGLMATAADGTDKDVLAYAEAKTRHQMIQEQVAGITAEAGRALAAFKKLEGSDEAKSINEFLKQSGDQAKDLFQLKEEAKFGSKLQTPQQLSKFINDSKAKGFKDAILEYYINALISGPITHLRYAAGNALNALWTPLIQTPIAAGIGVLRGAEGADRVFLGEAGAQLYGIVKGSRDGISAAIEAFKTGVSPTLPGEKVSEMFENTHANAIPGTLGKVINLPSKSVAGIHSFFKSLRYEQNIQALAYREAAKQGLEPKAFSNVIVDMSIRPTPEMMESATQNALKELYMAPTDYHSAMASLTRFTNQSLLAKIIVPFMKIGSQITRNAFLEQTPLGAFDKEIRANLLGVNGGAARDFQAAKITGGIALIGVTVGMTAEGMATGDGPTDPKERSIWLLNHRPNSLKVGDITIPYQGLGSLGMLMRFSANMTETAHGWSEEDGGKIALAGLEGITKSVLDDNFMRGVKDMLDAVYHPEEYGARYLQGFVTNWLPFSVGMSQMARQVDPYQREVRSHGLDNAFGIMDEARSKIPFLSETLQPRMDRFGEPIANGGNEKYVNDPVVQRMEALNIGVGQLERKIRGIPLNDQQYADYSQIAGRMAKMRLNAVVANPGFSLTPSAAQIETISKIVSQSRSTAQSIMQMKYPDLIKQANDAKIVKQKSLSVTETTRSGN